MKLVIDISEERYKDIQRIAEVQLERNHFQTAEQIIAKGELIEQSKKIQCEKCIFYRRESDFSFTVIYCDINKNNADGACEYYKQREEKMKIEIELPDKDYQVMLTKIMLLCRGCKITEIAEKQGFTMEGTDEEQ